MGYWRSFFKGIFEEVLDATLKEALNKAGGYIGRKRTKFMFAVVARWQKTGRDVPDAKGAADDAVEAIIQQIL